MIKKFQSCFQQLALRWQMLIGTALVGTGLIAIVGSLLIALDLAKIHPLVKKSSSRQSELIAKLSIEALIVKDRPALQTLIDGLKDLDAGLVKIELLDIHDEPLAYWKSKDSGERTIASHHQISHAGRQFGTLYTEWSYAHFANPILKAKGRSIIATFVALIVLMILLAIILEWYLIHPLQYLEQKVRSVADDFVQTHRHPTMIARELRAIEESLDDTARALTEKAQAEASMRQERSRAETAEAAAQAKMDFLSLMSHEIRTPLGAMMGFGKLLESATLSAEETDILNNLNRSGKFLLRVLNDILDLSKIEANGIELESLPFDPIRAISELKSMVEPLAKDAGITLQTSCQGFEGRNLIGDQHRLCQVMMNLVGNAVKFTEAGGVTVQVKALESTPEHTRVRFRVTDTGIGMTSEQCERIFAPFAQADSTTTRKFGGTGLGLSVAKDLVNRMGGDLKVESEPGLGSTFSFELCFQTIEAEETDSGTAEPEAPYSGRKDLRILVAEDEHVNRLLVEKIFATMGHEVEFAVDGKACIEILNTEPDFDVIFLDLHMPHVGGIEIARQLRDGQFGKRNQTVNLAIFSADVLAEQEGCDLEIDAFIGKPIDHEKLRKFLVSAAQGDTCLHTQMEPPSIPLQALSNKPLKALVVEDLELNRKLIAQILRRMNVDASFAEDGIRCVDILADRPEIDLILLDVRMPRMDGYTVARRIRSGACGSLYTNIPIAIVSAEAYNETIVTELEIFDHISKPIDITKLEGFLEMAASHRDGLALSN